MDLTYTNDLGIDEGVILKYSLDYEESADKDECDFTLKMPLSEAKLSLGAYIYIDETGYGGRIDSLTVDTSKETIQYTGKTWYGIISNKIIEPDSGEAYLTLNDDLNANINLIINRCSLNDLFEVSEDITKTVTYKFDRYIDAYTGLLKMLSKNGYKLKSRWNHTNRKVTLWAEVITNFDNEQEIADDLFDFKITKGALPINHVIGLGTGELTERQVIHRYLQKDGSIGTEKYYTGIEEIAVTYENTSVESLEDLTQKTEEYLEEQSIDESLDITNNGNLSADIGDKITAKELTVGISVAQYVINKIIKIGNNELNISYGIGEKAV